MSLAASRWGGCGDRQRQRRIPWGLERIGAAPTPEIAGHSGEERVPDPVTTSSVLPPSRTPGIVMGLPGC